MTDIATMRQHFEFMRADHYMTEAEYDKAAEYGMELVELLIDSNTLIIDLAEEFMAKGTYSNYFGGSPRERQLAGRVNKALGLEPCPKCGGILGHRVNCPDGIAFTNEGVAGEGG